MRLNFKKNHIPKEVKKEMNRREELLKGLYQILLENCPNAQDLKTRVEVVNEMINREGAKLLEDQKKTIGEMKLPYLNLKAQEGKGSDIEQKIIDFLADEKISTAQTLLQTWMITHDAFVRKQMLESKPADLKIEFKN